MLLYSSLGGFCRLSRSRIFRLGQAFGYMSTVDENGIRSVNISTTISQILKGASAFRFLSRDKPGLIERILINSCLSG